MVKNEKCEMKYSKKWLCGLVGVLVCVLACTGCASYVETGNWGGPTGGGVLSPDGTKKAFISVAVSDRYKKNSELSPHLIRFWISDVKSGVVLDEQKATINGIYVRWVVVWDDSNSARYEVFDHGPNVTDLDTAKRAPLALKRVLATYNLRAK
jgi:hypothetical protein